MRGLYIMLALFAMPLTTQAGPCRIDLATAEWAGCDAGVPIVEYFIRLKGCGVGGGLTECTIDFVDNKGNALGGDYFAPPDPSSCTLVGYGNQVRIFQLAGAEKMFAEASCGVCGGDVLKTRARIRGDAPECE